MKKVLFVIIALILFVPMMVLAEEKVKVYIFEAGGCPYCEAEMEYLKGLDSYNKKFTIVTKEAYKDHVNWEDGKDYELAVKVADAFHDVGFDDATAEATPFVVISDLYAAANYSEDLESIINDAYEKGDKDIVKCIEDGKTDCLDHLKKEEKTTVTTNNTDLITVVIVCTVLLLLVYLVKSSADTKKILYTIDENLVVEKETKSKKSKKEE